MSVPEGATDLLGMMLRPALLATTQSPTIRRKIASRKGLCYYSVSHRQVARGEVA